MNNALTKTLTAGLMHGLKVQLTADWTEDFYEMIEDLEIDESKFLPGSIWNVSGYCDPKIHIPMGDGDIDGPVFTNDSTYASFGKSGWKPILFPMSALTKEIEFKGKRFVPIGCIYKKYKYTISEKTIELILENGDLFICPYGIIEWLIEHHFNVYGLSPDEFIEVIEENNPYKI